MEEVTRAGEGLDNMVAVLAVFFYLCPTGGTPGPLLFIRVDRERGNNARTHTHKLANN